MISILLVRKIAQLFLIMILGYLLVKLRILKTEESIVLSKLSLYLVMPAAILSAFQVDFKPEIQAGLMLAFVAAVAIHILLLIIGHISGSLFHFEEIDIASIIYSNAGNLIIPIVTAVLGTEWVIYSTAFLSVQLIFLWTHCKLMFSKEKKRKETSFSENHSQCKHDRHFYWRAVHVVGKPLAGHHPIAAETQQCR